MNISYIQDIIDNLKNKRNVSREKLCKKRELNKNSYISQICSQKKFIEFTPSEREVYIARMKYHASKLYSETLTEYSNYGSNSLKHIINGNKAHTIVETLSVPIVNIEKLKYTHTNKSLFNQDNQQHNKIIDDWIIRLKQSEELALLKYIELLLASSDFMLIPVLKEEVVFNKYLKRVIINIHLVDKDFLFPDGKCKYDAEINKIIISKCSASSQNDYLTFLIMALGLHISDIFTKNNFYRNLNSVVINFYHRDVCYGTKYLNIETGESELKDGKGTKPFDQILSLDSIDN